MKLEIQTNAIQARHFFDSLERDQLPFAISRAINRMAWDIREKEQDSLEEYFEIRTAWLKKKGAMPVIRADKRQSPDIHAIIGIKDEIAAMSITGGTKEGRGGSMAVPLSDAGDDDSARSILNPGRETLPKSKWPGKIVKERKAGAARRRGRKLKPKPFFMESKSGKKFIALRSSSSRLPLKYLYVFKDSVDIKEQWPLIENAEDYVSKHYDPFLVQELDKAVRSMRV